MIAVFRGQEQAQGSHLTYETRQVLDFEPFLLYQVHLTSTSARVQCNWSFPMLVGDTA